MGASWLIERGDVSPLFCVDEDEPPEPPEGVIDNEGVKDNEGVIDNDGRRW